LRNDPGNIGDRGTGEPARGRLTKRTQHHRATRHGRTRDPVGPFYETNPAPSGRQAPADSGGRSTKRTRGTSSARLGSQILI
jgi:hypothetical protein